MRSINPPYAVGLILYLFVIEHLLWPFQAAIRGVMTTEVTFLDSFTTEFPNIHVIEFMLGLFVIRIVFCMPVLNCVFIYVAEYLTVRNIFFLAILNVLTNVTIVGLGYMFDFVNLVAIIDTIGITFASPFIAYLLPFSRRRVRAYIAMSYAQKSGV